MGILSLECVQIWDRIISTADACKQYKIYIAYTKNTAGGHFN